MPSAHDVLLKELDPRWETAIPDSKIYYALDGLSKKGMIVVQQGNPSVYKAMHPKEAIANLKQQLIDNLNEKMREAGIMVDQLSPIYDSALVELEE